MLSLMVKVAVRAAPTRPQASRGVKRTVVVAVQRPVTGPLPVKSLLMTTALGLQLSVTVAEPLLANQASNWERVSEVH